MHSKGNHNTKRQPIEWENTFASNASNQSPKYTNSFCSSIKKKDNNNDNNQKIGSRPKQTFLQRRHTDGQEAHEKIHNIINIEKCKSELQ